MKHSIYIFFLICSTLLLVNCSSTLGSDQLKTDFSSDQNLGVESDTTLNNENLCDSPPSGVVCGDHISASDWELPKTLTTNVTIPQGKIIASKFITSNDPDLYGTFNFQTPVGGATPSTNVWVSSTPGGDPLSSKCFRGPGGFIYSFNWFQHDYKYCDLELNSVYYLNMEHVEPNAEASVIIRDIAKMWR